MRVQTGRCAVHVASPNEAWSQLVTEMGHAASTARSLPLHTAGSPSLHTGFTEFSGQPQCFLTEGQLVAEMRAAGFVPDKAVPLTEYNRPRPGSLHRAAGPVIYEAAFRREAHDED